jgi:GMP synthase-like glutamine amidotransferase
VAGSGSTDPGSNGAGRSDARPWAIMQHVDHEGPGMIEGSLDRRGLRYEVFRMDRGDALPDPGSIDGLVVMGGPMGVHDTDRYPWLVAERELIAAVATSGRPVLGVCLGAQQLAAALGAEVTTGPTEEIGLGQVELTEAGRRDRVFGPEYGGLAHTALPCVHWHRDTFSLPDGAVHLAGTRLFPHQAFRWGDRVYALQFHVEVDHSLAKAWKPHLPAGVTLDGPGVALVESVGTRLLQRFVDRAAAIPRSVGARSGGSEAGSGGTG